VGVVGGCVFVDWLCWGFGLRFEVTLLVSFASRLRCLVVERGIVVALGSGNGWLASLGIMLLVRF